MQPGLRIRVLYGIKQTPENFSWISNRPLALRGRITNASFKQWVEILLMPKIDRARKNYLTPEIWEETHLWEIFYGTLILQQSSMTCIGRHVRLQRRLPCWRAAKTTFAYILLNVWSVMLRCAGNVTTSSFQQFPGSWSAKFLFTEKEVIRNFKNHILVTWYTDLPILRKPNHYYLFKIWPTNRFRRQNHLTFIFIYT